MSQGAEGGSLLPMGVTMQALDTGSDVLDALYESYKSDIMVPMFSQSQESASDQEFVSSQMSSATTSSDPSEWKDSQLSDAQTSIDSMANEIETEQNENLPEPGIDMRTDGNESCLQTIQKTQRQPFTTLGLSNFNRSHSPHINLHHNPMTPTKPMDFNDPLTPTANLKMLISAASPEIRNRDNKKKELFRLDEQNKSTPRFNIVQSQTDDDQLEIEETKQEAQQQPTSRKEKSLGLLCQRFLAKFPDYPNPYDNIEISLDNVARDLNVERRRIYDIVNVLESVEIVSRLAKNRYAWHGKTNLFHTLARLKTLAEKEGFAEAIERMKDFELSRECGDSNEYEQENSGKETMSLLNIQAHLRKDRSLGIMSQKFLMLFLVSKPKTVNLDLSAKILIGDPNVDRNESAKFKTKIRRLYDIANILTSLNLIKKVQVTEVRGRKPAFRYIGPDVDDVQHVQVCSADGTHRPSSRHSLLDCVQNPTLCNGIVSIPNPPRPAPAQYSLLAQSAIPTTAVTDDKKSRISQIKQDAIETQATTKKTSFVRHSSFEQICAAAERERSKLYSGKSPSPFKEVKRNDIFEGVQKQQPDGKNETTSSVTKQNASKISSDGTNSMAKRRIVIIQTGKEVKIVQDSLDGNEDASSSTIRRLTLTPVNRPDCAVISKGTAVRNKAVVSQPDTEVKCEEKVQNTQEGNNVLYADSEPKWRSKRSVQKHHLGNDFEYEIPVKRCKGNSEEKPQLARKATSSNSQDINSGSSQDAEVERINMKVLHKDRVMMKGRPSPLRALHLEPEFHSSPQLSNMPHMDTPSPDVADKMACGDLDLASPLPIDMTGKKVAQQSLNTRPRPTSAPLTKGKKAEDQNAASPKVFFALNNSALPVSISSSAASSQKSVINIPTVKTNQGPSKLNWDVLRPLQIIPPSESFLPQSGMSPFSLSPSPGSSSVSSIFGMHSPAFRIPDIAKELKENKENSQDSPQASDLNVLTPSINQIPLTMISPQHKSREQRNTSSCSHAATSTAASHTPVNMKMTLPKGATQIYSTPTGYQQHPLSDFYHTPGFAQNGRPHFQTPNSTGYNFPSSFRQFDPSVVFTMEHCETARQLALTRVRQGHHI